MAQAKRKSTPRPKEQAPEIVAPETDLLTLLLRHRAVARELAADIDNKALFNELSAIELAFAGLRAETAREAELALETALAEHRQAQEGGEKKTSFAMIEALLLAAHAYLKADPLIALGVEIERLSERADDLDDARHSGTASEQAYREAEENNLRDRVDCLRAYATTLPATSTEGALLQIAMANMLIYKRTTFEESEGERTESSLRFSRLIYSAFGFLEDDGGEAIDRDLPSLSVQRHLEEHLNPWHSHERNLAIAREEIRPVASRPA